MFTKNFIRGHINATQLCKAGNKLFGHWYTLESTKKLINTLETNIGIPILNLVEKNVGGNHKGTWIHPDLAIQLAQWLSPEFAIQVSCWIRTLFVDGKVEANIKLLKEKDNTINDCKKRIKHLENQILKKQSRTKYIDSKFVVYIITNKHKKKERTYTIGKAIDLVQRLSTYNKLEDHEVIYYKAFIDEEQMKTAEDMVLKKLHQYKEIECRDSQENNSNYFLERHKILNINLIFYWATDLFYQLVKKDIKLFTKAIDDAYYFFNN